MFISSSDTGFHPFHLHGHDFQVVNKAMDYTSNDTELNPPIDENQVNPIRRDTVTVPPGGSTTIRWRADNPGAWLFHCHVDWHHTQGTYCFQTAFDIPLTTDVYRPGQCLYRSSRRIAAEDDASAHLHRAVRQDEHSYHW